MNTEIIAGPFHKMPDWMNENITVKFKKNGVKWIV